MAVHERRASDAARHREPKSSWIEIFPFFLMAAVLIATIVTIVVTGDR